MPRPEKVQAVEEMTKLFEQSSSFFITDYQGLNVADMTVLRKNLRDNKVRYLVAKNTLMRRAAKAAGKDSIEKYLSGPTAIAFAADDPTIVAKILHESYKSTELPRIKVFVVEDQEHEPDDLKRLAELPTREVLLSQLVAAVESPLTSLVGAIDAVMRELVGSIDALAQKKTEES
jgi:large subunit ribosomal protein L10